MLVLIIESIKNQESKGENMLRKLRYLFFGALTGMTLIGGCAKQEPEKMPEAPAEKEEEKIPADPRLDRRIDWESLWNQNKDIVAWISIPQTTVDFPVLQSQDEKDDYYYLERNLDKEPDIFGSLFIEKFQQKSFDDPVTIMYGHTSFIETPAGKEMFSDLHKYEDAQYLTDHPALYIYTPEKAMKYEIFCSSVFDDRYIPGEYEFSDPEEVKKFISDLESAGQHSVNETITLPEDGKYLILSTCMGVGSSQRLIVASVLQETKEL